MALINGNGHVDRIAELKKQANESQPFDPNYTPTDDSAADDTYKYRTYKVRGIVSSLNTETNTHCSHTFPSSVGNPSRKSTLPTVVTLLILRRKHCSVPRSRFSTLHLPLELKSQDLTWGNLPLPKKMSCPSFLPRSWNPDW
jgi:hypothetical protein